MSEDSKIAGVILAGLTALVVAFFSPVGDWMARKVFPDDTDAEAKAAAKAERLQTLIGHEFSVQGDSPTSMRLLCNPVTTPTGWHLTSVTGTAFVLRRDRTPEDSTDNQEHACSPWDDCASKSWTYDLFEGETADVRELKFQGCNPPSS